VQGSKGKLERKRKTRKAYRKRIYLARSWQIIYRSERERELLGVSSQGLGALFSVYEFSIAQV